MRWVVRQIPEANASDDRIAVVERGGDLIVAVADGAGGMVGASRAASLAIGALRTARPSSRSDAFVALLAGIDQLVLRDARAGETTAAIASITKVTLTGASCGDSSIWTFTSSRAVEVTMSQRRLRLGSGLAEPVGFASSLSSGARVLIGSDGLFDAVDPEPLRTASLDGDLDRAGDRLVDLARTPAGTLTDDLALVLVEVG